MQKNSILDSCPWAPATAHGLGTLTEMYVIYMQRFYVFKAVTSGNFLGNIYGYILTNYNPIPKYLTDLVVSSEPT